MMLDSSSITSEQMERREIELRTARVEIVNKENVRISIEICEIILN